MTSKFQKIVFIVVCSIAEKRHSEIIRDLGFEVGVDEDRNETKASKSPRSVKKNW